MTYPQPAPPPRPRRVSPSGWWYLVPVLLLLAALVVPVVMVVGGFRDAERAALDSNLTGIGEVQSLAITEPGGYTIGYYGPSIVFSDAEKEALAEALRIEITPIEGGEPLPLEVYEGFRPVEEVDPSGRSIQYVPLRTVRFEVAGEYQMRTLPTADIDRRRSGLVVLESPYQALRDSAEQAVLAALVLVFLGILLIVILAVTRKRAKRAAGVGGPPPPDPGGPWVSAAGAPPPPWGWSAPPPPPGPAGPWGPPAAGPAPPPPGAAGPWGTPGPSPWAPPPPGR